MKIIKKIALTTIALFISMLISCGGDTTPKPQGYLRLDYPVAQYVYYNSHCPFSFDVNSISHVEGVGPSCNLTIQYPTMKATVYITYKPINSNIDALLRDAQKLTYGHTIKADGIQERPYINPEKRVYGMFYQVGGDAATNAQFYVTDSIRHFVTGSVYFYAKPNFDSIMPAASYIREDMYNIVETLNWK